MIRAFLQRHNKFIFWTLLWTIVIAMFNGRFDIAAALGVWALILDRMVS